MITYLCMWQPWDFTVCTQQANSRSDKVCSNFSIQHVRLFLSVEISKPKFRQQVFASPSCQLYGSPLVAITMQESQILTSQKIYKQKRHEDCVHLCHVALHRAETRDQLSLIVIIIIIKNDIYLEWDTRHEGTYSRTYINVHNFLTFIQCMNQCASSKKEFVC